MSVMFTLHNQPFVSHYKSAAKSLNDYVASCNPDNHPEN